jgi:hypothetical protein
MFRLLTNSLSLCLSLCLSLSLGRYEAFRRWASLFGLDFAKRQSSISRVPKVVLAWVNRLMSSAFTKWVSIARGLRDVGWRRRATCLTLRLLLRNKAKKLLADAFNQMRVGVGGGGGGMGGGGGNGYRSDGGYWNQSIAWTEVPPSPFL